MAIAQQLLSSGRGIAGSAFFYDGMSSAVDPMSISDRAYRSAENVLHRGGAVKTRPGYRQIFTFPAGKLQGLSYFRPISGEGGVVVAVAGKLYQSSYPFLSYIQIPNVQLYKFAERVWFSVTTRSSQHNSDGTVQAVEPKRTLIVQDGGYTRAAYWDGVSSGHSDPTVVTDSSDNVLSAGIPLGGPIAWSGNRLWSAQGNKLFSGDISDPLSFTENQYAGEGGFFAFDDDVVALAEVPSLANPSLVVFTNSSTWQVQSNITNRANWSTTANFKTTIFPDIGCTSQRSVVAQNGMLWWMTPTGLTNINSAVQSRTSSELSPKDAPMAVSKSNTSPDLSSVAVGKYENFILCSVPNGSKLNRHTWVLDQSVDEAGAQSSWAGVWTGTQPVEWASGLFGGIPRVVHISVDYDGKNRLWEAFVPDRKDNGSEIECFVETKTHVDFDPKATGLDLKKFVFAEVTFVDIAGEVDVSVYWAGTLGKYKKLADYILVSSEGSLSAAAEVTSELGVSTYRPQKRILRLPEVLKNPSAECTSLGLESKHSDWVDTGFSLLIRWTGRASLQSYRIFSDPYQELGTGSAAFVEAAPRVLDGVVCA